MKKLRKVKKHWVAVSIGIVTSALLVNNVAANEVGGDTSEMLRPTTVTSSTIEKPMKTEILQILLRMLIILVQ